MIRLWAVLCFHWDHTHTHTHTHTQLTETLMTDDVITKQSRRLHVADDATHRAHRAALHRAHRAPSR